MSKPKAILDDYPGPVVQEYVLTTRDGGIPLKIRARKLGSGSSDDGERSRWFEVAIYQRETGAYVIHTQGKSRIPGETTYARVAETTSAFDIIELLTAHRNDKTYLPRQSARAIAQAAQWDDDVRDAYVNRAVL